MPYNELVPDHMNDYFNLAFSNTNKTKLIMFQYKIFTWHSFY